MVLTIRGKKHSLWRAVDTDRNVLDILVESRWNKQAAKRFFRKLLKELQYAPGVIIPDKLKSYETIQQRLDMVADPMQQFHDLSTTYLQAIHLPHDCSQLSNRQTHHRAQIGDETGESHSNAPLSQDLVRYLHWRFVPSLALRTPAFIHAMMPDL